MKTLITILLVTIYSIAFSQDKYQYCQIEVIGKLNGKAKIALDFGEDLSNSQKMIRDKMTGKVEQFNSAVDGINYMVSQGYEYVESYTINVMLDGSTSSGHLFFIFRKKISEELQVK